MDVEIHDIAPCFADKIMEQIEEETTKNPELIALKEVIHVGWPTTIKDLPGLLRPYWNYRDELSFSRTALKELLRKVEVVKNSLISKLRSR